MQGKSDKHLDLKTSFTVGSPKIMDNATETMLATHFTLSLQMLREELQASRETVLVQIKTQIATSFK